MEVSEKILKVQGVFKHYDWGGKTFLASLMHQPNEEKKPYAEYWLGSSLHAEAGTLPYLFKVQDVEKMLSIQVHPSKKAAKQKFREENEKGVPLDAPHRNFKDDNHKPELLSPLGEFYLLHGFKPADQMTATLASIPELNFLLAEFGSSNYKQLYSKVMTLPQEEVNKVLQPLVDRIIPHYHDGRLHKTDPHFWAARAALTFNKPGIIDRGIFSIYLFNLVSMKEGQALFQDAGLPHAYLEGQTMEIMANSDNVLRGGLTPKHIDVQELLEHVEFRPTVPNIITGQSNDTHEEFFNTPADDFQLSRVIIEPHRGIAITSNKPDIYFIYSGSGSATADEEKVDFFSGDALLVLPGHVAHFASNEKAVIFRASVP